MLGSKLNKNQKLKIVKKKVTLDGELVDIYVEVRHNDECGNGHNSFHITSTVYEAGYTSDNKLISGGSNHSDIIKLVPHLAKYIKWHGMTTESPLHYIANTLFHSMNSNLEAARRSAIWHNATLEQLQDEQALNDRLPSLLFEFKKDVEDLGLIY